MAPHTSVLAHFLMPIDISHSPTFQIVPCLYRKQKKKLIVFTKRALKTHLGLQPSQRHSSPQPGGADPCELVEMPECAPEGL